MQKIVCKEKLIWKSQILRFKESFSSFSLKTMDKEPFLKYTTAYVIVHNFHLI